MKLLDVADDLLQSRGDGEAAAVRHLTEEQIEIAYLILHPVLQIAVAHRQLVKIAHHGHVQRLIEVHKDRLLCRISGIRFPFVISVTYYNVELQIKQLYNTG